MGRPGVFELCFIGVGLRAVRVGSAQGLLFRVQKPSPFLQSEELEEKVCKVEPARGLQQLLRIQCDSFPENGEGDRSWNDVVNAQVIQMFRGVIREHREDLPTFEFQQS